MLVKERTSLQHRLREMALTNEQCNQKIHSIQVDFGIHLQIESATYLLLFALSVIARRLFVKCIFESRFTFVPRGFFSRRLAAR